MLSSQRHLADARKGKSQADQSKQSCFFGREEKEGESGGMAGRAAYLDDCGWEKTQSLLLWWRQSTDSRCGHQPAAQQGAGVFRVSPESLHHTHHTLLLPLHTVGQDGGLKTSFLLPSQIRQTASGCQDGGHPAAYLSM